MNNIRSDDKQHESEEGDTEAQRRRWYRNPVIIVAIIAGIVIPIIIYLCNLCITSPPPPDFSISINPMKEVVQQGGEIETVVTVKSIHGYKHPVVLSARGQDLGLEVSFSPRNNKPSYISKVTINVNKNVLPGEYEITIRGTGADGTEHRCNYFLIITPLPDFSISVDPMEGEVQQGSEIEIDTTVTVDGIGEYKDPVSLIASGQPSDVEVTFSPTKGEPSYTSTVTINVDKNVSPGEYEITIRGTGADRKEHSCNYILTVTPIGLFVGSINSDVFHDQNCSYLGRIREENKIYFSSYDEAVSRGYRPCRVCLPELYNQWEVENR